MKYRLGGRIVGRLRGRIDARFVGLFRGPPGFRLRVRLLGRLDDLLWRLP